jgi:Cof subfamily protein (haloacid dehalogenase superfamily)
VDGTLLRSDGKLPQAVVQACRAAHHAGCVVAPATARPPRSMRAIMKALNLAAPAITYNGAMIWNPLDDRPQFHEPLDGAMARRIIDAARHVEPDLLVGIEVLDRWFTDRIDPSRTPGEGRMIEPDDVGPLDRYLSTPITQLNLFGTPVQVAAARAVLEQQFWRQRLIGMFHDEPWLVRIVHPMADKGIALQRMAQHVGIARDEVAAIGDGVNDTGMVGWAGFGIAVANGSQQLIDIADALAPANDQNGVARAIQRFVLAPA